jgi:hypothetical protein
MAEDAAEWTQGNRRPKNRRADPSEADRPFYTKGREWGIIGLAVGIDR